MKEIARIVRKNARIIFQKNTINSDQYRNRVQTWADYFVCFAYADTRGINENGNEIITEERSITFETRWCPELAVVTSTEYRIIFNGEHYNIRSVDMMNYQGRVIRFLCRREPRS